MVVGAGGCLHHGVLQQVVAAWSVEAHLDQCLQRTHTLPGQVDVEGRNLTTASLLGLGLEELIRQPEVAFSSVVPGLKENVCVLPQVNLER